MIKWILGILVVVAVLAGIGIWWFTSWIKSQEGDFTETMDYASQFAQTHTATECAEETAKRAGDCSSFSMSCLIKAQLFMQVCFDNTQDTLAFCQATPYKEGNVAMVTWATVFCAEQNKSGQGCISTLTQLGDYCSNQLIDEQNEKANDA
ncbi:hypothetical protein [Zooshikella sp. RANM57]|uniref:hypothetical protein n=1 Tax=Zooshikella sp. RANM57 TaxID=3425863 RepID=UPI003D701E5A